MKFDIIVWDWDNTLLDSRQAAELALNDMAKKHGLPKPTEADVVNVIGSRRGEYWLKNYPKATGKIIDEYLGFYVGHAKGCVRLFPEVPNALSFVQKKGIPQVIASNKNQEILDDEVRHFGIEGFFDKIVGGRGVSVAKPTVEFANIVLGKPWPKHILMIGDGESDMMFAKTMGAYALFMRAGGDKVSFPYHKWVQNMGEVLTFLKENL
ncbi:MAG: HAD family hydrolase [Pseudomonadota bacterium]|nr:HAD family hydrolase [Pseudomonadota bacterium]